MFYKRNKALALAKQNIAYMWSDENHTWRRIFMKYSPVPIEFDTQYVLQFFWRVYINNNCNSLLKRFFVLTKYGIIGCTVRTFSCKIKSCSSMIYQRTTKNSTLDRFIWSFDRDIALLLPLHFSLFSLSIPPLNFFLCVPSSMIWSTIILLSHTYSMSYNFGQGRTGGHIPDEILIMDLIDPSLLKIQGNQWTLQLMDPIQCKSDKVFIKIQQIFNNLYPF